MMSPAFAVIIGVVVFIAFIAIMSVFAVIIVRAINRQKNYLVALEQKKTELMRRLQSASDSVEVMKLKIEIEDINAELLRGGIRNIGNAIYLSNIDNLNK